MSVGHKYDDIMEYTWAQFHTFCKAAEKSRREAQAMFLGHSALANHGKGKAIQKEIKTLLK